MSGKPTLIKPRPTGTSPAKPPPKPKKPSSLKFVRAQYGFIASEEGELTFNEGDLICILDDKSDPDWCKARVKVDKIVFRWQHYKYWYETFFKFDF